MHFRVGIRKHKDGRIELTQPYLIDRFFALVNQDQNINVKSTSTIKPLLNKDTNTDGLKRKYDWNYRQAIDMLTYLQGTSRSSISMPYHQAAGSTVHPKLSHERAVLRITRYLKGTQNREIIFNPDSKLGIE